MANGYKVGINRACAESALFMQKPALILALDSETMREDECDGVAANTASFTCHGGSSIQPSKRRTL